MVSFDETVARHFLVQLADGLMFLEKHNIVHRGFSDLLFVAALFTHTPADLKPQNLLLSSFELDAKLKLADFGFARTLDASTIMV